MPLYQYECTDCKDRWNVVHMMSERANNCPKCSSENIWKLPSNFSTGKNKEVIRKVGQLTEEFIEESREELDRYKEELENNR